MLDRTGKTFGSPRDRTSTGTLNRTHRFELSTRSEKPDESNPTELRRPDQHTAVKLNLSATAEWGKRDLTGDFRRMVNLADEPIC